VRHIAAERRAVLRRVGSTELARRDLGFEAAISVREGLRDLIEWRAQDHDDKEGIPQ
jgi:nucleoside-diphosphate-sugar epimerase